jgi:hypothetical protein
MIERGFAAQWADLEGEIGTIFDSSVAHGNCRGRARHELPHIG